MLFVFFSLEIVLCAWLRSVAWPVEIERERRGRESTEHRAETEIDYRLKDGGEKLPWLWSDQIVRCKDALKQSPQ